MKKLRTGIIGCGKVADFHAKALASLEESEFAAVCGHTMEKTVRYAEKYGVKPYTSISQMIKENQLDAVAICTPHTIHAENVEEAAACGCSVIVEKPLASSYSDCLRIVEAGRKNGVTVGQIVQRRFYRPCMRVKEAIDAGKLGTPILGMVNVLSWRDENYYQSDPWRGTWQGEGGGVMATQATHQIDLLLWYMGKAKRVYGIAKNFNHPYIEVEDTAVAVVEFENGGLGNLVMTNSTNPALYGKVHVVGTNGATVGVQTDGGAMFIAGMSEIAEPPYNDIWTIAGESDELPKMQEEDRAFFNHTDPMYYYHRLQIKDFLDALLEGRRPLVDAEEGMRTVQLFNAVYEATKTGKVVEL